MFETLELEVDPGGIARLTLSRADKHNAMSGQMIAELKQAAAELGANKAVRAVLLSGAGDSFCAGADLGWMRAQMVAQPEVRFSEARALAEMLQAFNNLPKPLIGAIQGNAFGGGIGLISVCDMAIGADHVKMALTETRLGLIPATIGPYVIARMGASRARRVVMSGRVIKAREAVDLGLLARVVPAGDLVEVVEAELTSYLKCAPGAVAAAKAMIHALAPPITDAIIDQSIAALVAGWETDEAKEGIAAFFDKRKPNWAR
ncbi:crotonase/enoyl-CoA hydratase family protein [Pontibaca salina]|uniref:Crotonase/enoyl-CoA hydratase family protein n=1 Tax=Pontibaca salina TaxID=2795731 RepID=A0A934M0Z1_9RHOB|nr:crotonase/enoyl-CoA hydratase family protein [Pontibaca salina]MBI6630238.1 crotonase/enoyl-CoA hydratase family protein [Pontibaca salina]